MMVPGNPGLDRRVRKEVPNKMKHGKPGLLLKGLIVSIATLGLAYAVPACAQDSSNPSASESMHRAGESAESAISNAAHGTATAMRDTKITAKVKTALYDAGLTKQADIHVTTTAGVVELNGVVPSSETAMRAEQLAKQTEGVKAVNNDLKVGGMSSAN
jgi:hyperosmotically inducible protein